MEIDAPTPNDLPEDESAGWFSSRWRVAVVAGTSLLILGGIALAVSAGGSSGPDPAEAAGDVASSTNPPTTRVTAGSTTPAKPTTTSAATTTSPATTNTTTTTEPPKPPLQDPDAPSVVARPVPQASPTETLPEAPPPLWAASRVATPSGYLSTDIGCTADLNSGSLDSFFAGRLGPVLGWDYQHVYPLGGDRYLWLFQDTFIDQSGAATTLGQASFVHNTAMLQEGNCFRLLHRGSADRPLAFEPGSGETSSAWFWPMGGEVHDGLLHVYWVKMVKDAADPTPPDGLGWHPTETWIGTYDPNTLARLDFRAAANSRVAPIYGYALASDATHTYLFGNSFEQNLAREGGYFNGPHSGTRMYLARVPRGQLLAPYEYRTADGWSADPAASEPILQRHWAEFPMQARYMDGQWVAVATIDGYWGDWYSMDVARDPWGPWTTIEERPLQPRGADPLRNTYHAHLSPWRDGFGNLLVTISNNARDMLRDAWPNPSHYRPMVIATRWADAPVPPPAPTTTLPPTTTTTTPPTTSTTSPATTTTSTSTTSSTSTTTTSTSTTTSTTSTTTSSTVPTTTP